MRGLQLTCMLGAFLVLLGPQAHAQQASDADTTAPASAPASTSDSLNALYQRGVRAFRQGWPARAEPLLRGVFSVQPAYAPTAPQEPVAYWLGRAHLAQRDTGQALLVWEEGLEAQQEQPARASLTMAHACLQLVSEAGLEPRMGAASSAYRALIGRLGRPPLAPPQQKTVRPYAAQLGLILPASMRRKVSAAGSSWSEALEEGHFAKGAGARLLAWWRSQDPLPATARNERLAEHLRRVAHAEERYAWEERLTGLDARGETYVRLGAPPRQHVIRFNETTFIREVFRFGVNVARGDFPSNEIWIYPTIDESGKYIFIEEQGKHYRLGGALDLLPQGLRQDFGNTERGQNQAYSALAALRYLFEELSLHYSSMGELYGQIVSYQTRQENMQDLRSMRSRYGRPPPGTNTMTVGEGSGERTVFSSPRFGISFPNSFASQVIQEGELQARQLARRRTRDVPRQHTRVAQGAAPLPVHVRTARFLEENGTTRTEIYWSTSVEALELSSEMQEKFDEAGRVPGAHHLLDFSAVQYTPRYRRRAVYRKRYLFEQGSQGGFLRPQTAAVKGDTALYHLALQWGQRPARIAEKTPGEEGRNVHTGRRTHLRTYKIDSLRALSARETRLEMSDLKPMRVPEEEGRPVSALIEAATPYPYADIDAGTPLLLRFEVYHLTWGPDDETRYTVEYEVQRRTERGGLRGLFQGDKEQRTSTQTTYTGQSRKVEEYILLDPSNFETDEEGQITITVRVTDENTGQTQERVLSFDVLPRDRETRAE